METAPNSKISDDVLIWIMEYAAAYGLDTLTDGKLGWACSRLWYQIRFALF